MIKTVFMETKVKKKMPLDLIINGNSIRAYEGIPVKWLNYDGDICDMNIWRLVCFMITISLI
jgi:hypothetical protein